MRIRGSVVAAAEIEIEIETEVGHESEDCDSSEFDRDLSVCLSVLKRVGTEGRDLRPRGRTTVSQRKRTGDSWVDFVYAVLRDCGEFFFSFLCDGFGGKAG